MVRHSFPGLRSLAIAVLFVLIAGLAMPGEAAAADRFTDLAGHWSKADVESLAARGVMQGYPDGSFRPDQSVNRAEFYAMLARTLGKSPIAGPPLVPVTPPDHWAIPVVNALASAGILTAGPILDLTGEIPRTEIAHLIAVSSGWIGHPENQYLTDTDGDEAIAATVAHGIMTGYPDATFRPWGAATRAEAAVVILRLLEPGRRPATWREQYSIDGLDLGVIRVNLGSARVKPKVAFGDGVIGGTESLASMAQRTGAVAAINGSYFQAYDTSIPMESYGTLFTGGNMVQTGWFRSAIGFWADGTARIDTVNSSIDGLGAGGQWWGSHGLNRYAKPDFGDDWAVVYTPAHGTTTGLSEGTSVVVRGGIVTQITTENVPIPADGYLIHLHGAETAKAGTVFQIGQPASFVAHYDKHWNGVQELIQTGPRMVKDYARAIDFAGERFTETKITQLVYPRSAVALTDDGLLLLIQSPAATVSDLADALIKLGVRDAMCLDSGGSSGLWYAGETLVAPGRELATALVILVE